ncbi:hypothetical protein ACROYT_G016298 [Oculina patagonica]
MCILLTSQSFSTPLGEVRWVIEIPDSDSPDASSDENSETKRTKSTKKKSKTEEHGEEHVAKSRSRRFCKKEEKKKKKTTETTGRQRSITDWTGS